MKVKICGITNLEDALICESLGANALGFIFYDESKRRIDVTAAKEIIHKLSPFTMKVGVFVNENPDTVNRIIHDVSLNTAQLHGDEEPEYLEKIYAARIKTFRIKNNFNFESLNRYKNCGYLLDTFSQIEYGGTGKRFNWEMIPISLRDKIILAGGISTDNIEQIFNEINPTAIDILSSLEIEPGKKDKKKVEEFFNKIKTIRSKKW
jgi:phosphoribosylanthranilate isomerase